MVRSQVRLSNDPQQTNHLQCRQERLLYSLWVQAVCERTFLQWNPQAAYQELQQELFGQVPESNWMGLCCVGVCCLVEL